MARFSWAACGIALLLVSGCGGGSDAAVGTAPPPETYAVRCQLPPGSPNALVLPAPTGERCIGKLGFRLVDSSRAEKNVPDKTRRRELSVKVWYPTNPAAGGLRAHYLDPTIAPLVKAQMSIPATAPNVVTNAGSAAALQAGTSYPVVIFSPGYGMVVELYSTLLEDLASQGMVVVAIDHPYISGATSLANGQVVEALAGAAAGQPMAEFLDDAVDTLVADQRYVLDWLQGPNTGMLGSHLNLARIGIIGHSIGGAAAIQTARSDERVKAGLDVDGTVYGGTAGRWHKPVMFLLASNHTADPTVDAVLRLASGPRRSVTVQDAGHMDFSDLKWVLSFYVPGFSPNAWSAQGLGSIEASKALKTTRQEALSFLQSFVSP